MKVAARGKTPVSSHAAQGRPGSLRITLLVALLSALTLSLAGIILASRAYDRRDGTVSAPGKVVNMIGPQGSSDAKPLVRFSTPDGQIVDFVPLQTGKWPALRQGDQVTVMYPPDHPGAAQVNQFTEQWLPAIVCGAGAVLAWLVALVLRRKAG
ncbi:DUF3592 domain-containing protein [Silvimonas amylolytica]|uniref:DUF3592 domain-containing protein n=1 Tax=Silvimonas amylolytica TaxID=449663 RepID=A0ABQ2PN44_9NEIS|nr:DUF3592 domain-containing protein [Silvimonas amylolytica]GGP26452.1 hypothetical protein GCM10010971_22710 [Silvimonas amylolytica]